MKTRKLNLADGLTGEFINDLSQELDLFVDRFIRESLPKDWTSGPASDILPFIELLNDRVVNVALGSKVMMDDLKCKGDPSNVVSMFNEVMCALVDQDECR